MTVKTALYARLSVTALQMIAGQDGDKFIGTTEHTKLLPSRPK